MEKKHPGDSGDAKTALLLVFSLVERLPSIAFLHYMPKTSKVLDFLTVQVQESKLIQLIPGLHLETGPDFAKSAAALCCEQGLSGKMKLTS